MRRAQHRPGRSRRSAGERQRHARHERNMCVFCTERFRTIGSAMESKAPDPIEDAAIVISASGMATGGRVLHHLKAALPSGGIRCCSWATQGRHAEAVNSGTAEGGEKIHGENDSRPRARRAVESCRSCDSNEILRGGGIRQATHA